MKYIVLFFIMFLFGCAQSPSGSYSIYGEVVDNSDDLNVWNYIILDNNQRQDKEYLQRIKYLSDVYLKQFQFDNLSDGVYYIWVFKDLNQDGVYSKGDSKSKYYQMLVQGADSLILKQIEVK